MEHACGMLVVGQQPDGGWAVTEAADRPILRFKTYDDALRHAQSICRRRPELPIATSAGAAALAGADHAI